MFWIREIAGWIMVALGLVTFWICYSVMLKNTRIFEAGPLMLIGIILFRGGIHLLKVAVAARICQQPEPKKAKSVLSARLR